jgi:nitrogen fixation/metabolism regulation signal transduction histidine kinase
MDIATLVLDYVRALAWPAVVIGLAFMFRSKIADAVGRLTEAQFPGGKLAFRSQLDEDRRAIVAQEAMKLAVPPATLKLIADEAGKPQAPRAPVQAAEGELDRLPIESSTISTIEQAETLAIRAMRDEMGGVTVARNVFLEGPQDVPFDGLIVDRPVKHAIAIDVRVINTAGAARWAVDDFLRDASLADANMKAAKSSFTLSFILLVVAMSMDRHEVERLRTLVERTTQAKVGDLTVRTQVYELDQLVKRYEPPAQ